MNPVPTNDEIRDILVPLWIEAVLEPKYDHVFDYTGGNSEFNNGYDDIYAKRLAAIKREQ
jgi:hypothetical protein